MTNLPDSIPLGQVRRRYRGGVDRAQNVRSARDLPSRLLLGELDERSFCSNAAGWHARYQGVSSRLDLRWNQDGLETVQRWHGHDAVTHIQYFQVGHRLGIAPNSLVGFNVESFGLVGSERLLDDLRDPKQHLPEPEQFQKQLRFFAVFPFRKSQVNPDPHVS